MFHIDVDMISDRPSSIIMFGAPISSFTSPYSLVSDLQHESSVDIDSDYEDSNDNANDLNPNSVGTTLTEKMQSGEDVPDIVLTPATPTLEEDRFLECMCVDLC